MEKGSNKTFVLVVLVILAASMLSAQLTGDPSGMLARQTLQRQAPVSRITLGQCYDGPYDTTPYKTTLTNCCKTDLPNYKWAYRDATIYC